MTVYPAKVICKTLCEDIIEDIIVIFLYLYCNAHSRNGQCSVLSDISLADLDNGLVLTEATSSARVQILSCQSST